MCFFLSLFVLSRPSPSFPSNTPDQWFEATWFTTSSVVWDRQQLVARRPSSMRNRGIKSRLLEHVPDVDPEEEQRQLLLQGGSGASTTGSNRTGWGKVQRLLASRKLRAVSMGEDGDDGADDDGLADAEAKQRRRTTVYTPDDEEVSWRDHRSSKKNWPVALEIR